MEIVTSSTPAFDFKQIDMSQLDEKIKEPHRNAVRMLLKMVTYEKQDALLPAKWEIEHIFPQKWQTNYFPDVSDEVIKEKIEHIGNKLPFEKKLNIVAGNGYFKKKQNEYSASSITVTREMLSPDIHDWDLDSIVERDIRVSDEIHGILKKWDDEYKGIPVEDKPVATEEEVAMIKHLKEKGLI